MTTCSHRGFTVMAVCACVLLLVSGTHDAQAGEGENTTKLKIVTATSWKEFRDALEKTYTENGYSFSTWVYLGCDAEYQYAVNQASIILRLKKKVAPADELAKVVQKQCERSLDFLALGDLDLPWTQWGYLAAFSEWSKKSHLDTSLWDQAEESYRKSHSTKGQEWWAKEGGNVHPTTGKDSEGTQEEGGCQRRSFKRANRRLKHQPSPPDNPLSDQRDTTTKQADKTAPQNKLP